MVPEITATELVAEITAGKPLVLIDVRELHERTVSALPGSLHLPLDTLPEFYEELDPSADIVLICRSGVRSSKAAQFLIGNGFSHVRNLVGGMKGYAAAIDPSMPVA